jgi:hypothetical protein
MGYSSIMLGARQGAMSRDYVADRFAALDPPVLDADVGAHFRQRCQQAGAERVQPHAGDGQVGARDQQSGDQRKRGRG